MTRLQLHIDCLSFVVFLFNFYFYILVSYVIMIILIFKLFAFTERMERAIFGFQKESCEMCQEKSRRLLLGVRGNLDHKILSLDKGHQTQLYQTKQTALNRYFTLGRCMHRLVSRQDLRLCARQQSMSAHSVSFYRKNGENHIRSLKGKQHSV